MFLCLAGEGSGLDRQRCFLFFFFSRWQFLIHSKASAQVTEANRLVTPTYVWWPCTIIYNNV